MGEGTLVVDWAYHDDVSQRWANLRWLLTVVVVGFFFVGTGWGESVAKLDRPASYVADFAGVIDDSSKQNIENLCLQVYEKAHATIVVVTVNSLDGVAIEDFTTQLEDKWKVGPKGTDRGLVLVFAIQDHKRRIEVGNGLEGILNDAKVGDIGRDMVPLLKQSQYGPAVQLGVQEVANVIATDAGVTLDAPVQHTYHREAARQSGGRGFGIGGLIFLLVIFFLIFRGRGGRGGGGGSGLGWFVLGSLLGGGGRGGGGGFGGGGGDSGGRGDSGGGGDFGGGFGGGSEGGGASGDW